MAAEVTSRKRNVKSKRKNSEDDGTTSSSSRPEKTENRLSNKNGQLKNFKEQNRTIKCSMSSCITFLGLSVFLMLAVGLLVTELHVQQKGMVELLQHYIHRQLNNLPVNVEKARLKMDSDVKASSIGSDEVLSTPGSNEKEYISNIIRDPTSNIEEAAIKENIKDSLHPLKIDMSVDSKKKIVTNEEGSSADNLTVLESQIIPDANVDQLDSFKKKSIGPNKTGDNKKNSKGTEKQDSKKTKDFPEVNVDEEKERSHSKLMDLYTKVEKLTEDILAQDPENDMVLQLAPHLAGVIKDINSDKLSGIEESLLHIKEILLDLKERLKDAQGLEKNVMNEGNDLNIDSASNKIPVDEVIPDPVYIAPRGSPSIDKSLEQGAHKDSDNNHTVNFSNIDSKDSNKDTVDEVIPKHVHVGSKDNHPTENSAKDKAIGNNTVDEVISDPVSITPKDNHPTENISAKVKAIGLDTVDEVISEPVHITPKDNHPTENNSAKDKAIGIDTVDDEVISDPVHIAPKDNQPTEDGDAKVHSDISSKEQKLEASDGVVMQEPIPNTSEQNKADTHINNKLPSINKVENVEAGMPSHHLKFKELEESQIEEFSKEKLVPIKSGNKVNSLKGGNNITPDETEKLNHDEKMDVSKRKVKNLDKDSKTGSKTADSQKLKLKSGDSVIDSKEFYSTDSEKKTGETDYSKKAGKYIVKENALKPKSEEKIDVFKTEEEKGSEANVEDLNFVSAKKLKPIEEKLGGAQETTVKINTDKISIPIKETVLGKPETNEDQILPSKIPMNSEVKKASITENVQKSEYSNQQIPAEINANKSENIQLEDFLENAETLISKDPAKALDIFNKLILESPKNLRSLVGKARALDKLAEKEQSNTLLEKSIMAYFDVIDLIEENSDPADRDLLKEITETCIEKLYFRGWRQKVAPLLLKMLNHFPSDIKLWNNLGRAYLMTNDNVEALKVFKKVLQTWPDNGFAQVHYGFILKITNKNLTEAIKYLHQGIQSREEGTVDGRFYLHLGDAYQRIGNNIEAYKVYDDAASKGLFLSKYQRSLHNIDRLKAKPVWTLEETTYSQFFRKLEKNWEKIMSEGLSVMDIDPPFGFKPEGELLRKNGEWSQFDLFARGVKNKEHCAQVPFTCSLIENFSPAAKNKRGQVKFSLLFPGTVVFNHTGPTNCRLRSHLGLITPPGAALKVVNNTLTWEAGKVFVFDDSFEHEVWHKGNSVRLILIVDVWHPQITEEEKLVLSPI